MNCPLWGICGSVGAEGRPLIGWPTSRSAAPPGVEARMAPEGSGWSVTGYLCIKGHI